MRATTVGLILSLSALHATADDQTLSTIQEQQPEPVGVAESDSGDRFSVTLDATYTSQYFFRGIVQETDGLIFQPSIELGVDLLDRDDWSISGYMGIWNSFHDEETGSTDTDQFVSTWYEVDLYAGVSASSGRMSFDVFYTNYSSPNGAFGSVNELGIGFGFDDSGLWGDSGFSLNPSAQLAFELGDNSADGGVSKGVFFAIAVEPGMELSNTPVGSVAISFPIELGLSLGDYYELGGDDETFGYLSTGVGVSIPLGFMPDGFGDWSLNTGLDFLLLGDHTESYNGGEDSEWIFHAGVSLDF